MRNALEPYLGKEITIISTVKGIKNSNNKHKFKNDEKVLLSNVIIKRTMSF
ncbi:hypothetical protein H9L25_05865 [Terrisporobacter mayombei]|nr:hypothetical protein [Terrisporobacter mayombei]